MPGAADDSSSDWFAPVVAPQHEVAIFRPTENEGLRGLCTHRQAADPDAARRRRRVFADQSIGGDVRCCPRQGALRQSVGWLLNVVRLATGLPFRNTQRGFQLLSPAANGAIFSSQRMDGLSPDVDHIMITRLHGFRVAAVPASWNNTKVSKLTLAKTPRSLADLVRLESKPRAEFTRGKS